MILRNPGSLCLMSRSKTALKPSTKRAASGWAAASSIQSRTRRCTLDRVLNNYRLEFAGEFAAFGRTVGAAMALARAMAAEEGLPARVLRRLSAGGRMAAGGSEQYGFQDNDGLVRMELDFERLPDTRMRRLRAGGGRIDRRRGAPFLS